MYSVETYPVANNTILTKWHQSGNHAIAGTLTRMASNFWFLELVRGLQYNAPELDVIRRASVIERDEVPMSPKKAFYTTDWCWKDLMQQPDFPYIPCLAISTNVSTGQTKHSVQINVTKWFGCKLKTNKWRCSCSNRISKMGVSVQTC